MTSQPHTTTNNATTPPLGGEGEGGVTRKLHLGGRVVTVLVVFAVISLFVYMGYADRFITVMSLLFSYFASTALLQRPAIAPNNTKLSIVKPHEPATINVDYLNLNGLSPKAREAVRKYAQSMK